MLHSLEAEDIIYTNYLLASLTAFCCATDDSSSTLGNPSVIICSGTGATVTTS